MLSYECSKKIFALFPWNSVQQNIIIFCVCVFLPIKIHLLSIIFDILKVNRFLKKEEIYTENYKAKFNSVFKEEYVKVK